MKFYRLLSQCLKYSLAAEAATPLGFWMNLVSSLVDLGLQLAFYGFIFLASGSPIAGWSLSKLAILVLTFDFVFQGYALLFGANLGQIPQMIRDGSLDFYLLKPIDPRFLISFQRLGPQRLLTLLIDIPLIVIAVKMSGVRVSLMGIGGYIVTVVAGITVLYSLLFCSLVLSFWVIDVQGPTMALGQLLPLGRYPIDVFPRAVQFGLKYIVPIGLIAVVPADTLMRGSLANVGWAVFTSGIFLLLSGALWRAGLRKYTGASA